MFFSEVPSHLTKDSHKIKIYFLRNLLNLQQETGENEEDRLIIDNALRMVNRYMQTQSSFQLGNTGSCLHICVLSISFWRSERSLRRHYGYHGARAGERSLHATTIERRFYSMVLMYRLLVLYTIPNLMLHTTKVRIE